jgi:hypothetical protein
MAIAFRAAGTGVTDATAPFSQVVGFPAGLVAGDICILIGTTDVAAGGTMSISNNGSISSWNAIAGTPVTVAAGEKLYVWWGRYVSGSTGPTVDSSADHIVAAIVAYSGCVPNGSPIDVVGNSSEATSDTSFSFATGLTTGENNTMCITICTSGFDSVSSQFVSAFTNANLTSCTRRPVTNQNTSVGGGGGFGIADGILATAGAMGTFATTLLNASPKAYIAFSLRPDISVNVSAGAGSLVLGGFSATVFASDTKNVAAGVGALTLTGFAPVLDRSINVGVGALTLTGFSPTVAVTTNTNIAAGVGALTLTGFSPTLDRAINVGVGSLTLTGFAPVVTTPVNILPGKGDLVLSGFAPTIQLPKNVNADTGQLTLNGFSPTVAAPRNILADVGQLILTGITPTVSVTDNVAVNANTEILLLAGFAPQVNLAIFPGAGSLIVTGFAPTVSATNNKLVQPGTGSLIINGFSPSVNFTNNKVVNANTGLLLLTGFAPSITISFIVFPGTGTLILTGQAPQLNLSIVTRTGELILEGFEPILPIQTGTGELILNGFPPYVRFLRSFESGIIVDIIEGIETCPEDKLYESIPSETVTSNWNAEEKEKSIHQFSCNKEETIYEL